jgi:hypothetical protein
MKKFQVNDRVRRIPYTITVLKNIEDTHSHDSKDSETTTLSPRGPLGTVQDLREETTLTNRESRERSLMLHVLWDNGTLSYHGPEALEPA